MKTIILCGGKGTRLREETEYRPKPMVPIGGKPILWHIMKTYASHGHKDFVLCLGYKGDMIRDFFRDYLWHMSDVTMRLGREPSIEFHNGHEEEDWQVTLADTGEESMTAYRILQVRKYIPAGEDFLLTYGDGVGDIDINAVIAAHRASGRACTLTGVHPPGRFGELGIDEGKRVASFNEKPQAEGGYINGGYMVCSPKFWQYLPNDPGMMLEQDPMRHLAADGELGVYMHDGFWQPMDTYQEWQLLNRLWQQHQAPWKVW